MVKSKKKKKDRNEWYGTLLQAVYIVSGQFIVKTTKKLKGNVPVFDASGHRTVHIKENSAKSRSIRYTLKFS